MQTQTQAAPQFVTPDVYRPLDIPATWLRYSAFEPPLLVPEIVAVQKDIDSIIGTTRENQSIAKLVWNGDIKYWKQFHNKWDAAGRPVGNLYRRPQVLYQSIFDAQDRFVRDSFPPRWLIMTRIEPEQYAATWASDSRFYCPDRKMFVQLQPSEPPPVMHVWFQTIAVHNNGCCQIAASEDRSCYGKYAHPRYALDDLRSIRKGMEEANIWESHPFDSPDRVSRRLREKGNNNYIAQAMRDFREQADRTIEESPMALADPVVATAVSSLPQLREHLREESKRAEDVLEKQLKARQLNG